jgi:hypothetical protein
MLPSISHYNQFIAEYLVLPETRGWAYTRAPCFGLLFNLRVGMELFWRK